VARRTRFGHSAFRGAIPIHHHQLSRAPPHLGYIADLAGFIQTRGQLGVSDVVVLDPRHLESPSNQSTHKLHRLCDGRRYLSPPRRWQEQSRCQPIRRSVKEAFLLPLMKIERVLPGNHAGALHPRNDAMRQGTAPHTSRRGVGGGEAVRPQHVLPAQRNRQPSARSAMALCPEHDGVMTCWGTAGTLG